MDKDELDENANRLIFVKKSIAELQEEEKAIKKKLEPHVGLVEPLLRPDGMIYNCTKKMKKTFNRLEVLQFVEERYGTDVARAIDSICTKNKLIAQRLHVKTWDNED